MPLSYLLLIITTLAVLFGFTHRVLDRMRMTDRWALIIIIGMIIGTFLPNIHITKLVSVNIGGALIPIGVSIYLFIKADSMAEKLNAVIVSIISGILVYIAGVFLPHEPEAMLIEPNYIYGIIGGLISYLFGRSRRCAFIAGVMGIVLSGVIQAFVNYFTGRNAVVPIGGAGSFDAVVISMIIAVFLSEVIGETREKLQGGTLKKDSHVKQIPLKNLKGDILHLKKDKGDEDE